MRCPQWIRRIFTADASSAESALRAIHEHEERALRRIKAAQNCAEGRILSARAHAISDLRNQKD